VTPFKRDRLWRALRHHDAGFVAKILSDYPNALLLGCVMAVASYPTAPNITASRLAYVASTLSPEDHPGTLRALHSQGTSHYALNNYRTTLASQALPYARGELAVSDARLHYLAQVAGLRPDLGLRSDRLDPEVVSTEAIGTLTGEADVSQWLRGRYRLDWQAAQP